MTGNLLKNGDFEADWGSEKSHRCLLVPPDAPPFEKDIGNIFTPAGWTTWFHHDPGTWDQPEVRDAWKQTDPHRVHGGQKGVLLFTFFRGHDGGFLQKIRLAPGTRVRFTAWAHAWSNTDLEGHEDCFENSRCSCGVGKEAAFILEDSASTPSGDAWDDAVQNFTFYVGIDPTGGTDPSAATVVWGPGAHIYNTHAQVPAVEAVAAGEQITVFVRSRARWPFKHNDAYWDDAELTVLEPGQVVEKPKVQMTVRTPDPKMGAPVTVEARSLAALTNVALVVTQPSGARLGTGPVTVGRNGDWHTWTYTTPPTAEAGVHAITFSADGDVEATVTFECARPPAEPESLQERGKPRVQYERTYVLLPPSATAAWAQAAIDASWDRNKFTVGGSADDAGIGDLDFRRVIAINPAAWPTDLHAFFNTHYPGITYVAVEADTPDELRQKLERL